MHTFSSVLPHTKPERRTHRRDAPVTEGSSVQTSGQELRIRPNGRLDAHCIDATLEPAQMSKLNVCVDLSLVHFVDMGALRTLERLHQQCRSEGRELRLINLRDPIRLTVDITGFRTRLPVEQPLEQPIEQPLEITSADAQFEQLIQELLLTDPKQILKSV